MKSRDINMLMQALEGFKASQRAAYTEQDRQAADLRNEAKNDAIQAELMSLRKAEAGRADKRLKMSERDLLDRQMERSYNRMQQLGQGLKKPSERPTVFDETLRLTKDFQTKQKQIQNSILEANMRGDGDAVADLNGQMQALQAQGKLLQQKAEETGTTEPLVEVSMDGARGEKFKTKVPYSKLADYGFEMPDTGAGGLADGIPDASQLRRAQLEEELVNLEEKRLDKMKDVDGFNARDIFSFDGLPFGGLIDSDEEKLESLTQKAAEIRKELGSEDPDVLAKQIREQYQAGKLTKEAAKAALEALKRG